MHPLGTICQTISRRHSLSGPLSERTQPESLKQLASQLIDLSKVKTETDLSTQEDPLAIPLDLRVVKREPGQPDTPPIRTRPVSIPIKRPPSTEYRCPSPDPKRPFSPRPRQEPSTGQPNGTYPSITAAEREARALFISMTLNEVTANKSKNKK